MSSFYLYLNSDGSKDIHPNNHGDDFIIELNNTIDLTGKWEAGLVEMSYVLQYFGNVMDEYGAITISSNKKAVYPTKFISNYGKFKELYMEVHIKDGFPPNNWLHRGTLYFGEKRHFTWKSLKRAFRDLKHASY